MCREHTQHCVNLDSTRKTVLLHMAAGRGEGLRVICLIQEQDLVNHITHEPCSVRERSAFSAGPDVLSRAGRERLPEHRTPTWLCRCCKCNILLQGVWCLTEIKAEQIFALCVRR